jgi:UDP-2,3-diacylglucosamine pyrophosphatase LpxH
MNPVVYVVSDLHLGAGRRQSGTWDALEDFFVDDQFCKFLDWASRKQQIAELVIAGDFIDYTQILPDLALLSPDKKLGSTQAESLERTRVALGLRPEIAAGHSKLFQRLRQWLADGHSITIIPGNHDIDLLWPDVWKLLFDTIYPPGASGRLQRHPFSYIVGNGAQQIYIEHGHERDKANAFGDEMRNPFGVDQYGVPRLKRCWGTLFVDLVYNRLERDRWFIDNLKPITRVIREGLRNDTAFTASSLAMIVKFFLTCGAPPGGLGAVLGRLNEPVPHTPEGLAEAVADQKLKAYLEKQLKNATFREAFTNEIDRFNERDWNEIEAGVDLQPTLEQLSPDLEEAVVLSDHASAYVVAARNVLEQSSTLSTVIMGHTHGAIDGLTDPINLNSGQTGYYFNSGTWTPHLREVAGRHYTWEEMANRANYTSSLTFVILTPDEAGNYHASLESWARLASR